ncbi:DUF4349 domain-containing protein [Tautonia sociabilis]|uniref:DUF4349 domain-containing protein n=1 Tax=Tautonia sociabilis TaxID=2080755 RepID=A0A432MGC7_9BACT|nr:DUF4349 domain-containing protein [Tautonia sociabilis]RUL85711.1 DUF4349 domain-containing protein [Tautonia sociabilis]
MRTPTAIPVLLTLLAPGCGAPAVESTGNAPDLGATTVITRERANLEPSVEYDAAPARDRGPADMAAMGMMGMMGGVMAAAPASPPQEEPPPAETLARKIIYDAQIELLVEDLDPTADRIAALVEEHSGYIAEQDLSGSPGSRRGGRWTLRVPVERFEDLVRDLLALGELQRNQRTSQDVTEQYYDIEARIRNKRVEEQTLLKILDERSGKLEDVLKVEVELSRVRGEIEQLEGRLRVLANLSSLATITLSVRERDDYEPTPPIAPDFGTRIARAWASSLGQLQDLGENLVLFAVALTPWIPLILIGLVAAFVLLRWFLRSLPRLWELARRPLGPPRASS